MEEYISPDSSEIMSIIPIQFIIRVSDPAYDAPDATYNSSQCKSADFSTETILSSSM